MAFPTPPSFFYSLRFHAIDTVGAIVLWFLAVVITLWGRPYHRDFFERDPSLSFPVVPSEEVPTILLFFICFIGPGLIMAFSQVILRKRFHSIENRHKAADFFIAQASLFQCLGLTFFITAILKIFFGRQRPNFFAMCNYKGYRDAIQTGNFTEYFAITTAGVLGDLKYCMASEKEILESLYSHPSGHASLSFAGLGFLSLFLYHLLLSHKPTSRNHLWKILVFMVPIFAAATVAATRTRDYWHNFDDTLYGALIGFGCASMVFHINYSHNTDYNVEYIGDLYPKKWQEEEETLPSYALSRPRGTNEEVQSFANLSQ
eukprot:TRINITY_DN793_c0_g2_i2.p1 TRINITY_DN793_c0_g2~~TRINITY_DN793_c0_g2_i2.p1  ORF type:complete len:317 (-),score=23.44 TRINITY_DN793_c0_g2_i2:172-1122(-)